MEFSIRGLRDSQITTIFLDAVDDSDARRKAALERVHALSVRRVRRGRWSPSHERRQFSLLLFSQELLALLNAGLSIVEAIEALAEKESRERVRQVLTRLLVSLREGRRFSVALGEFSSHFPELYIGIVSAAEKTSSLPDALARFVEYQGSVESVKAKIVSALIYPCILMCVGGAVTSFLLGYVVPKFSVVYRGSGRELPLLSSLLMTWGQFIAEHTVECAAVLAIVVFGVALTAQRVIGRGGVVAALAAVPYLRERAERYELARLYLTLGILLRGGLPIVKAIDMAAAVMAPRGRERLIDAQQAIQAGTSISDALEAVGLTTSVALRLLRVGEKSGQMGEMMARVAAFHEAELGRWMERFSKLFEPILMLAIGLVVGTIVVLLYMPIFDLASSFQ